MTLHNEVQPDSVSAGIPHVGAMINNSARMAAALAAGMTLDSSFPVVDPDMLADEVRSLASEHIEALSHRCLDRVGSFRKSLA